MKMSSMFIRIGEPGHMLFEEVKFVPLKPIPTICAWCPDFDPKDEKNAGASHGLCPTCAARVNAELDLHSGER
jgi:hypothetical protein